MSTKNISIRQRRIKAVLARGRGFVAPLVAGLVLAACVGGPAGRENVSRPDSSASTRTEVVGERFGYRYLNLKDNKQTDEYLVILAFSGGGKRSAAFSYGALQGLRDLRLPPSAGNVTLLDHVDLISSVSGGSFTAAYYGMYREKIFSDYEDDFLKRDINAYIFGTYLIPWNWAWMFSSQYGTNDRMAEVYDKLIFKKATYKDLMARGKPLIVLNATEISYGMPFSFQQGYFDIICSDLSKYPVARAVAASNGFPVIFTPITLKSYSKDCPNMVQSFKALAGEDTLSRRSLVAKSAVRMADPNGTKYLHLMDGGIADNLALRGLLNALIIVPEGERGRAALRVTGLDKVRRILVIVVDGQAINDGRKARQPTVSSLGQIFDAVSGAQIDQYNLETLFLARREIKALRERIKDTRCRRARYIDGRPCADVRSFFVRVSIDDEKDPAVKKRLQRIPTGLTVDAKDVDALAKAGREAIVNSKTIRAFVDSLSNSRPVRKTR